MVVRGSHLVGRSSMVGGRASCSRSYSPASGCRQGRAPCGFSTCSCAKKPSNPSLFLDRYDAGRRLADALSSYAEQGVSLS
jgi:hypothetical protein